MIGGIGNILSALGNIDKDDILKMLQGGGQAGGVTANMGGVNNPIDQQAQVDFNPNPSPVQSAAPADVRTGGIMQALSGIFGDAGSDRRSDIASALASFGASMGKASAPSEDPANSSFLSALSQGVADGRKGMEDTRDNRVKRSLITGQTQSYANASDPNFIASKAMASEGMIMGPDGKYQYAPGYGEILDQNRHQKMADALTLQNAGVDRQIASEERQFGRQMDLIDHRANVAASNRPAMTPADKKFVRETQTSVQGIDQALSNLDRLDALNGSYVIGENGARTFKPGNVMSGAGVETRTWMGRNVPYIGGVAANDDQVKATTEYSNITGSMSLSDIKSYLTGPTSDSDVKIVGKLAASTEYSPEERYQLIQNARERLLAQRGLQESQLTDMGSSMPNGYAAPTRGNNAPVDITGLSYDEVAKLKAQGVRRIINNGRPGSL